MFTTGAFVAMAIGGSIGALLGFLFHALCAAAGRETPSPTSDAVQILERVTGDDKALKAHVETLVARARAGAAKRKRRATKD